ncbi:hypothetical protein F4775DRAFT_563005 [Biscogniauxia sp. FL1348]|nr:hypothetical protein F4775DRAFT_563005 [Biscogniauxia sp. FL1348]
MAPNTASLLPIIPRIFFLYIEPILITIGMTKQYANTHVLLAATSSNSNSPLPIRALAGPALSTGYLFSTSKTSTSGVLMLADLTH